MNKRGILEFLLIKYENEQNIYEELLKNIKETIIEMEVARSIFNDVSDGNLIEAAIYREEAAKKKFDYLISQVKEYYRNIENL